MKMQLLIIVPTILILSFTNLSPTSAQINSQTDQQALLAFKTFIASDPYGVFDNWNTSVPFCTWKGVSCNTAKQRVTSLNLANLTLTGSIAPHLGNLSFLHSLNLDNNLLSGHIPSELGRLFRLTTLNLSSNHLQGSIPASLGLCVKLTSLDLSHNGLEGSIPSEIGSLSRLDVLRASYNNLTGSIPPALGNLTLSTNIILSNNKLQGKIPNTLGDIPFLVNIDLGINFLDGEVPSSIFNITSLMQLILAGNGFSGTLPSDMFSRLTSLTSLSLGGNAFSGPLPVSLGNASSLLKADFSQNHFSGQIPLLWNLPVIQFLNLGSNSFVSNGPEGWDFLKSLTNSTQLQVFALDTNQLTGELPYFVGNLSQQLSLFTLGGNQIEGRLPAGISNLVGLTMISFEYNRFSGEIPGSIGSLLYLQNLYLHNNNFSGEIPSSLGNLTFLFDLNLSGNRLRGRIPPSLGKLSHLQMLDLSINDLNGTLPVEILNKPSFSKLLNLSFNSLTGHIPFEIGNLKMIQAIDVSSNQLSGEIPSTIGGCSNILYLNTSHNSLQGAIPASLDELRGIMFIDLSYNNLSGLIPLSLQDLKALQFLDLSMNRLQGTVPTKGVFSNKSEVFLRGNPGLCGGIPKLSLPKCSSSTTKQSTKLKTKITVSLVVGFLALLAALVSLLLVFLIRKHKKKQSAGHDRDSLKVGQHKLHLHTYYDIKEATENFSIKNVIGEGSFGKVFKGVFRDGSQAAIKVFNMDNSKASKSFLAECEALRNIRHRNLVRILGVCSNPDFKALVLPYMPNGSLETWLHPTTREEEEGAGLQLKQRLEIAKDVASVLEYLHHDCDTPVVHCDLKPSNVLLDENLCAHVADFGIARILSNNFSSSPYSSTLGLKGSIGYIAPEYGGGGEVSTRGDVYSYGIMLLEMFTGKRPTDEAFTDELDLRGLVSQALAFRVMDVLDLELRSQFKRKDEHALIMVFEIGLHCSMRSPNERPAMREVCCLIRNAIDEFSCQD